MERKSEIEERKENAGEYGTPNHLHRACPKDTPTPVSKQCNLRRQAPESSVSGLLGAFEECMTHSAGAAASEPEPPQSPKTWFFEIHEDHPTSEAASEAAALETAAVQAAATKLALAKPVKVLFDLPQRARLEGSFHIKNTSIEFFDPPASVPRRSRRSDPSKPVAACESPPATPRSEKPERVTPTRLPDLTTQVTFPSTLEPKTPKPVVVNLHQALRAPSTSTPKTMYQGAIQLNLAMWITPIPPFPIASSSSSSSQPVCPHAQQIPARLRLRAEHFPASGLP